MQKERKKRGQSAITYLDIRGDKKLQARTSHQFAVIYIEL